MTEVWAQIAHYEQLYEISNKGQIKRLYKDKRSCGSKIIKLNLHKSGHLYIKLCKKGKYKSFQVHRLVLETFVGPCPPGMECRHLDGDPANNILDNLRWGTRSENIKDAIKHKVFSNPPVHFGSNHPLARLNEKQVRIIKYLLNDGYLKQTEIAKIFMVNKCCICDIKAKRTWNYI